MISREERHSKIVEEIVDFSEIFETLALHGKPIFSDSVPTACICWNVDGDSIGFVWGKEFFDTCSDYKARFILCHEMLHIFLRHGRRGAKLEDHKKANIAMDLSINHLLVDEFGFVRGMIEGWDQYCWRDTVFKTYVEELPSFESYYAIDSSNYKEGFLTVDQHNFMEEAEDGEVSPELQKAIDDLRKKMSGSFPSHGMGNDFAVIEEEVEIEPIKKPKFETLVKKIVAKAIEKKKFEESSWTTLDRRLCEVAPDIPTKNKMRERKCRKKYKCAFFIDNSGSCSGYIKRFCKVAASLNPEVFEVEVYSFDTRAYKIPKINNSYRILGGGGTDFNCIEKSVEQDNPDVVFVVTDGFASSFVPKDKKKYFWFLVEGGSEAAIRGAGKIHRLSQFE